MNELENNQSLDEQDIAENSVPAEPIIPDTGPEIGAPLDSSGAVPLEPEAVEPQPESKARVFFRKLFRSTLGFLIIFGIGFAVAAYTIYKPAVAEQNRTAAELEDAQAQIADLGDQISALDSA
ncbi:MAG: hypothetical protein IMY76_08300, partial [Chloroflexi bacterium]|nr:hypothetical protein [Chloroflexota bacterium]